MDINGKSKVADIAMRVPGSETVFRRLGVDTSTGQSMNLEQVAEDVGVSLDELLSEIHRAALVESDPRGWPVEWTASTPEELVDHILDTYHKQLKKLFPQVAAELTAALLDFGEEYPELYEVGRLFERVRRELGNHLDVEEQTILPMLRTGQGEAAVIEKHIADLEVQHDRISGLLEQIRALSFDYPPVRDRCPNLGNLYSLLRELEMDTLRHMYVEENRLVPFVRERMGG